MDNQSRSDGMFIVDRCVERRSSVGAKCDLLPECEPRDNHFASAEIAFPLLRFYKDATPTEFRSHQSEPSAALRAQLNSLRIWQTLSALVLAALLTPHAAVPAQTKKKKTSRSTQPALSDKMKKAKEDVIAAAKDYKASLEKVLKFQEDDVKTASETVEKRKALLAENIISKKELEESERA